MRSFSDRKLWHRPIKNLFFFSNLLTNSEHRFETVSKGFGETKAIIKLESMSGDEKMVSSSGDRFLERIPAAKTSIKIESNVSTTCNIKDHAIDERKRQDMKHSSSGGRSSDIKKSKYSTDVQYGPEEGKTGHCPCIRSH